MKKLLFLSITMILVLALIPLSNSCQKQTPSATTTASPPTSLVPTSQPAIASNTYTNSENGFTVEYPADWDLEEGISGTIVFFAGPAIGKTGGMININIVNENLPESPKVTLEDYNKLGELQVKKSVENYQKLEEHNSTVSGFPAILRTYSFDMQGLNIKGTQAIFLKDNVAYGITFTATPDTYADYAGCFDLVMNSFKLD